MFDDGNIEALTLYTCSSEPYKYDVETFAVNCVELTETSLWFEIKLLYEYK